MAKQLHTVEQAVDLAEREVDVLENIPVARDEVADHVPVPLLYKSYLSKTVPATRETVRKLQKELTFIDQNAVSAVVEMARFKNIRMVGAPFEADHQLVSLVNQGVADYVLSTDSDMMPCGATKMIRAYKEDRSKFSVDISFCPWVRRTNNIRNNIFLFGYFICCVSSF